MDGTRRSIAKIDSRVATHRRSPACSCRPPTREGSIPGNTVGFGEGQRTGTSGGSRESAARGNRGRTASPRCPPCACCLLAREPSIRRGRDGCCCGSPVLPIERRTALGSRADPVPTPSIRGCRKDDRSFACDHSRPCMAMFRLRKNFAKFYHHLGRADRAFERAGDLSGNDSALLANVAQQFLYDLDYGKAAKFYERLLKLVP